MCHWASSRETSVWERVAPPRKTQEKWVMSGEVSRETGPFSSSLLPSQDWMCRLDHHQFT